jgi:hypothetical protein
MIFLYYFALSLMLSLMIASTDKLSVFTTILPSANCMYNREPKKLDLYPIYSCVLCELFGTSGRQVASQLSASSTSNFPVTSITEVGSERSSCSLN